MQKKIKMPKMPKEMADLAKKMHEANSDAHMAVVEDMCKVGSMCMYNSLKGKDVPNPPEFKGY